MSQNEFEKIEAEYFRLRGQLAAGRISQEQYVAALKRLVIQDAQGRSWMLGVDSGKWYVHNGRAWVEAQPLTSASGTRAPLVAPRTPSQSRGSRKLILWAAGCACFMCLIGILGLMGALGFGLLKIDVAAPPPRATPQLGTVSIFPSPTFRSLIPATSTPRPLLIQTPTPIATSTGTAIATAPMTNTPVPFTPTPTVPPGVYVTGLRLEPPSPQRRADVGFYPTFFNTTGAEQSYRWLVYIYPAGDLRRSFGETAKSNAPFPVGVGEQRANGTWKLTGGGECEYFVARVAWISQDNQPITFSKPDGQIYELPFSVCP